MNEFEYYVIERRGNKAFPLVSSDRESKHTLLYLNNHEYKKYIDNPEVMQLVFSKPFPRKAVIGDYFSQTESIVSEKIKAAIEPLNIKGIQLIPATVKSNKGEVYEGFYYVHIYNFIEAIDKETSNYELDEYGHYFIDSFKLDHKILEKIPLEERLVFKLKENGTKKLYHRSVVDAIMATEPEGVQFIKVENWVL